MPPMAPALPAMSCSKANDVTPCGARCDAGNVGHLLAPQGVAPRHCEVTPLEMLLL